MREEVEEDVDAQVEARGGDGALRDAAARHGVQDRVEAEEERGGDGGAEQELEGDALAERALGAEPTPTKGPKAPITIITGKVRVRPAMASLPQPWPM